MRKALVLVAALLLSGCASDDPVDDPTPVAQAGGTVPFASVPQDPLRFASGDFEGGLADTATFSITEQCFFDCELAGGEQVFDLSAIVPPQAPVELTVSVFGARASMTFEDATALGAGDGDFGDFDGQATVFGIVVTRAEAGKVLLHVYNPGGFGLPPNAAPTADWEARSVVRADRLVAGVPAAIELQPGESLNLTGSDVEEALLIAPDGTMTRDQAAPFQVTANGTAGTYILLMGGSGSTQVLGPAVPMSAKRMTTVQDEPRALASGSETSWTFTPDGVPLDVGLTLHSAPAPVDPFGGGFPSMTAFSTGWQLSLTAPGNVVLIQEDDSFCSPFCGGGFRYTTSTEFLDERLRPGEYQVSVTYTGNEGQAFAWATVIV